MIVNINDLRNIARRRLPKGIFDYVDGGAEDEVTLRNNRAGFQRYTFDPRVLVDVSQRAQSTTVRGQRLASPLILAPTGFTGMLRHKGETLAARAAAKKGLIYTCSTMSICSMEEIAAASSGPLWFQLYVWRDREVTHSLIERAKSIGAKALVDGALGGPDRAGSDTGPGAGRPEPATEGAGGSRGGAPGALPAKRVSELTARPPVGERFNGRNREATA